MEKYLTRLDKEKEEKENKAKLETEAINNPVVSTNIEATVSQ